VIYAIEKTCFERPSFGGKPMQELPYRLGVLLSSYSQAINKQNGTTGSLFQQKTNAKCITTGRDAQNGLNNCTTNLTTCMLYIHQNPLKAYIVDQLEDWQYSSFQEYIGKHTYLNSNKLLLLSLTGYDTSTLYEDSYGVLDKDMVENIW